MKSLSWFLVVLVIVVAKTHVSAQTSADHPSADHRIWAGEVFAGMPGPGGNISAKQHAPFSTLLDRQNEQTLNDGTHITHDQHEVLMRDGKGRTYRAMPFGRPRGSGNEAPMLIWITDPVLRVAYQCSPFRKTCTKRNYRPLPFARLSRHPNLRTGPDVTVEDLGESTISGIAVHGTRVTRNIPEGRVGNDRPFSTIEEVWYSKQLDVDVQLKTTDPRLGTRMNTMTEVNLSEPDPKYFRIPDGYTLVTQQIAAGPLVPFPRRIRHPGTSENDPPVPQAPPQE